MKSFAVLLVLAGFVSVNESAWAGSSKRYPVENLEITLQSSEEEKTALIVRGEAKRKTRTGRVTRVYIEGPISTEASCKKHECLAELSRQGQSLIAHVRLDSDQDGNIEREADVKLATVGAEGKVSFLPSTQRTVQFVEERYSWLERRLNPDNKNRDYFSITIELTAE